MDHNSKFDGKLNMYTCQCSTCTCTCMYSRGVRTDDSYAMAAFGKKDVEN